MTPTSPEVSIIIPTFNRLWSLPRAVDSCRHTACRTEIIVVDDGSTDATWEWLVAQPNVVSIRQDNWGKDWAVNRGLAAAQGEYVRFLDSDDWLLPGANDGQLALARSTGADVVVAGYQFYDEATNVTYDHSWVHCDDFIAQQLGECSSSHYSAYLLRKSLIEGIPHRQEFAFRDDRLFAIELALARPRVATYDRLAFVHRHHSRGRLQFQQGLRAAVTNWQHLMIYKKTLALLEARSELTDRHKKAAIKPLWPLAHWIAYTSLQEACEVAEWVYTLDPQFTPPEAGLLGQCYRRLGFRNTERLLRVRRVILKNLRLR